MQSINRSLGSPAQVTPELNLISAEKNSLADSEMLGIKKRIEENQSFLDELKIDNKFQNFLTLMRKLGVRDEELLNILTGQADVKRYLDKESWKKSLLKSMLLTMIEYRQRGFLEKSYIDEHEGELVPYLAKQLAQPLASIFKQGYLEADEKTQSKMGLLLKAIENEHRAGELDLHDLNLSGCELSGADFSGVNCIGTNFEKANLAGADFRGADLSDANFWKANLSGAIFRGASFKPAVLQMITEQNQEHAFEIHRLLSKITQTYSYEGIDFPEKLINRIRRDSTFLPL
ncbi:MAG: hypothetical protein K0R08_1194 [Solimicrobium sp.]|jgi:hypothetical protein|nr:hypothetical protein [Solimicrobium sp.]